MKVKKLSSSVLTILRRVREDPRTGPADSENLRKAEREFEKLSRSGKTDRHRTFRAARLVSQTMLALLERTPEESCDEEPAPDDVDIEDEWTDQKQWQSAR